MAIKVWGEILTVKCILFNTDKQALVNGLNKQACIQIIEPEGNPMDSLDGLNILSPRPVMVDELSDLVRRMMMAPA